MVFAGLLLVAPLADAGEVSAELRISTNVIARAVAEVQSAPMTLEITEADIVRGWVEATEASRVRIRTNDPSGYRLAFQVAGLPVRELRVEGLGDGTTLGVSGGEASLTRPHPGRFDTSVELNYRFVLAEDARPGVYSWPVSLYETPM